MRNIYKIGVGFMFLIASTIVIADSQVGDIYIDDAISQEFLSQFAKKIIVPGQKSANSQTNSVASASAVTPMAAASGISVYQIMGVSSASYAPWEPISSAQSSTVQNHGGSYIRVAVFQYGYGNANTATLAGYLGNHYLRASICGPLSAPYYCNVGDTITGYVDYYQFNGPQGGSYSSSASSVVFPYGTWTDSIYIK